MTAPVEIVRGQSPIILGLPHTGTHVPEAIAARLNANGRLLADTDWHIHTLYDGLLPDLTTVRATFHRYVIDANRDPSGQSLYPGQNTTGLVPMSDFDGEPIWTDGVAPGKDDITERLSAYHAPYHAALTAEIGRIKALHGVVVLYDCHSIRSHVPRLFEGRLPDFNIGTNDGTSCAPEMEAAVHHLAQQAEGFTSVVNGRFKGGWTTRVHGRPQAGVHALQMELAQSTHLATEAPPFAYAPDKAAIVRTHLQAMLEALQTLALKRSHKG